MTNNSGSTSKPIKKICIIFISFLLAVILISLTNIVLAHVFVATTILFPPKTTTDTNNNNNNSPSSKPKKNIQTKTVYVPPTQEDLERIRQELETSDPLPQENDNENTITHDVQSIIKSTETLLSKREKELSVAQSEIDELNDAYVSFEQRLTQDTTEHTKIEYDKIIKVLQDQVPSLRELLGRKTFIDLDQKELMELYDGALDDLSWLLKVDDMDEETKKQKSILFLNANDVLFQVLNAATSNSTTITAAATCDNSYLDLDNVKASSEFANVKSSSTTKAADDTSSSHVTDDTARESDLYELVQNIKHILSRRDLAAAVKVDDVLPSPISDVGVAEIRSTIISPMARTIEEKRKAALIHEDEIRESWMGKIESLKASLISANGNKDDGGAAELCTSPNLVEDMVTRGIEAIRSKNNLRSTLESVALLAVGDDEETTAMLQSKLDEINVPDIDYEGRGDRKPPTDAPSSKRTLSYLVDGPLLHKGVVGWIDYFVDCISGYDDNIDGILDWVVGEEGKSVGNIVVDSFTKVVRQIPFPTEFFRKIRKSGILGGRTRSLIE